MTILYENMILNKSMILHKFVQLCKRECFEIIWNELFNPVFVIYLPTDNKGLEIHFPVTKIHLSRVTGNGNPRTLTSKIIILQFRRFW
jgi:hypothetical protein